MFFASDNAGPVAPSVMQAIAKANTGYAMPYGEDPLTTHTRDMIRDLFEAPKAEVFLVPTGTAANALALGTIARPWDAIYCHPDAHIAVHENNAAGFYTGGARLVTVKGPSCRIDPGALKAAIAAQDAPSPGVVSLTQVTDLGTVYTLDEIRDLTGIARRSGAVSHMDGARFANALVALGCTPAEMSWKAGIDVLSFGGTKNGMLGAEAVIFFKPSLAPDFATRRLRGGHMVSRQRFMAAQFIACLKDDLWLDLAGRSNSTAERLETRLRAVPDLRFLHERHANIIFAAWPRRRHRAARAAGAVYYTIPEDANPNGPDDEMLTARLVTNWATTHEDVEQFTRVLID
ncbi:MAG: threonine aldolase family protein [Paracoccaceae bacterium]